MPQHSFRFTEFAELNEFLFHLGKAPPVPLWTLFLNKKVLLHEGKRHTARRITSAHYADLSLMEWGTPCPDLGLGPPISRMGYPLSGPEMGYPPSRPRMGYPIWTYDGYAPIQTSGGVPPSHPDLGCSPPPQWWTKWKHYLPSSFGCGR